MLFFFFFSYLSIFIQQFLVGEGEGKHVIPLKYKIEMLFMLRHSAAECTQREDITDLLLMHMSLQMPMIG